MKLGACALAGALMLITATAAQDRRPEATSLLGKPLIPPAQTEPARAQLEKHLAAAKAAYEASPADADAIIWYGRRTAYLGRYREAIDIFSRGIEKHPADARMYRHRGHRYLTIRELDRAVADFTKAAELIEGRPDEIEPDGQPNARNIPTSTLNSNIFYHLALAHYVRGDFERAAEAWARCREFSKNPDMLVATTHWQYMTLRRLGREKEAAALLTPITADMDIIENGSYHKLLLLYKGHGKADELLAASGLDGATMGYGVGNWHYYNGRRDEALRIWRDIVEKHASQWASFGYLASEAEVARAK